MRFVKTGILIFLTAIAAKIVPLFLYRKLDYQFGGQVDPGFENVEKIFRQNFENGLDFEGAAFAVCRNGKMVVDLWGGFADSSSGRTWKNDTINVMFSTIKAACALSIAVLVDRKHAEYDDLVTKYWPEFGQNGKDKTTIKMILNHQAGLSTVDEPIVYNDWRKMSEIFEKQAPLWELGQGAGYHAYTFPLLVDHLIRRIDPKHRSLGHFFKEEIAEPHGIDFYIGLPLELEHRVARISPFRLIDSLSLLTDSDVLNIIFGSLTGAHSMQLFFKVMKNEPWKAEAVNNPEIHALEIGIGSARGLAQMFCVVDSGKLISKSTVEMLLSPLIINEKDKVLLMNVSRGYGFFHTKNPEGKYVIGHPGAGGQNVKYDRHYGLSFGYVRNGLAPYIKDAPSYLALENAVYEAVRKHGKKH